MLQAFRYVKCIECGERRGYDKSRVCASNPAESLLYPDERYSHRYSERKKPPIRWPFDVYAVYCYWCG